MTTSEVPVKAFVAMNPPESGSTETSTRVAGSAPSVVPAMLLGITAYACALDNGFISDDFVMLGRLANWLGDFRTFEFPPEGNRLTLYALLGALRGLFGLSSAWFYAAAMGIHLLNVWLLSRLLWCLTGRRKFTSLAVMAFAVFQNPQEAVMWLAGVSDALAGLFTLLALLAWARERFAWSAVAFGLALASKESGVAILVLVPLMDWARVGKLRLRREYLLLLLPAAGFAWLFLATMRQNAYLSEGLVSFGPAAVLTLLNSAHRLAFPWLYVAFLAALAGTRLRFSREAALYASWILVTLAPYSMITYQNHVPSRNQYLAAMGVSALLALLLESLRSARLRAAFAALFVLVNIGYLWGVKDRQYLRRAAPTSRLLEELRSRPPGELAVSGFPLNPWIAREAARHVSGWRPEMIRVGEPCTAGCVRLRWNPDTERYAPDYQSRPGP